MRADIEDVDVAEVAVADLAALAEQIQAIG